MDIEKNNLTIYKKYKVKYSQMGVLKSRDQRSSDIKELEKAIPESKG